MIPHLETLKGNKHFNQWFRDIKLSLREHWIMQKKTFLQSFEHAEDSSEKCYSSILAFLFQSMSNQRRNQRAMHAYLSFSRLHHAYMPWQMSANPASLKLLLLRLSSTRVLFSNFRASPILPQLNTVRPQWYILPKRHNKLLDYWYLFIYVDKHEAECISIRSCSLQLC